MSEQPYMKFEIREKVNQLKENKSFHQLASLELQPIVKVYESENNIEISGYLVLNGEFAKDYVNEKWEEQYEQSDGIHAGSIFEQPEEPLNFQYQIPISIQIQADRVVEPSQVFVDIDFFDYEILSDHQIELIAHIKLLGVHPYKEQDTPVDFNYDDESSQDYQEGSASISYEKEINEQPAMENKEETAPEEGQKEAVKQMEDDEKKEKDIEKIEAKEGQQEEIEQVDAKETQEEEQTVNETMEDQSTEQDQTDPQEPKEQQAPKMKIGFRPKESDPKQNEVTGSNPLYSLIKKEKQQSVTDETTESKMEQSLSMEINESSQDESFSKKEEKTVEETIEVVEENVTEEGVNEKTGKEEEPKDEQVRKKSKNLLFSLLQSNKESRKTIKLYFVQKNDTLESIAEKYQIKVQTIVEKNHLSDQEIHEGQILYLPIGR
ncbi:LysM peptidoglycan-binding domain-containing protein [Tepidibacillus sp. LV47]|uniref:LysM peptidoglycan-binding domain-containing protein n=1 Tax=Tepidibacillus sp. LV47 TaxID=3398228 RepID=UPI003AB07EE7